MNNWTLITESEYWAKYFEWKLSLKLVKFTPLVTVWGFPCTGHGELMIEDVRLDNGTTARRYFKYTAKLQS